MNLFGCVFRSRLIHVNTPHGGLSHRFGSDQLLFVFSVLFPVNKGKNATKGNNNNTHSETYICKMLSGKSHNLYFQVLLTLSNTEMWDVVGRKRKNRVHSLTCPSVLLLCLRIRTWWTNNDPRITLTNFILSREKTCARVEEDTQHPGHGTTSLCPCWGPL